MSGDNLSYMMLNGLTASPGSLRKHLGRRARDARLSAGRSQLDVARAAGVSLPTLQRFEAGANVNLDVLVRVAIALDADRQVAELFPVRDTRTLDELVARRTLPQRGRSR